MASAGQEVERVSPGPDSPAKSSSEEVEVSVVPSVLVERKVRGPAGSLRHDGVLSVTARAGGASHHDPGTPESPALI